MRERGLKFVFILGCFLSTACALVAEEVYDVFVAGGTVAGVAAACEAAQTGARVFLAAPRPYLGEDVAGTLELMRDKDDDTSDPLYAALFPKKGGGLADESKPFIVKLALDRAVISNHVECLTGATVCHVTVSGGDFRDIDIDVAGGMRRLKARAVVDATSFGRVAEMSGAVRRAFRPGVYDFTRVVISSDKPTGDGIRVEPLSGERPFAIQRGGAGANPSAPTELKGRWWRVTVPVTMKGYGGIELARAEHAVRSATWTSGQLECADEVRVWLDMPIVENEKGVFLAGVVAASTADEACLLVKPGRALASGRRAGAAAAAFARENKGKIDPRVYSSITKFVAVDSADCDVFVAGAGTSGAPAAIAAARNGAKVIVADTLHRIGGMTTEGMLGSYYHGNRCGFTSEIDAGVSETGLVMSQAKDEWFRRAFAKSGVEFWGGARVTYFTPLMFSKEGRKKEMPCVFVVMADGTQVMVHCKVVIDATGNADLAAFAGEETEFINGAELSLQGAGMEMRAPGKSISSFDIGFLDTTDADDLFRFARRARFSAESFEWDQSQLPGTRERRRMRGMFYLTPPDAVCGRTYPDTIARALSYYDSHGQADHPAFFVAGRERTPRFVNIPYRALLPKKTEGLLVTGLGISAHRDVMPFLRMQPDVQNVGYAAGLAAALSVKSGCRLRDVDLKALQRALVEKGNLPETTLAETDNFPLDDAALVAAAKTIGETYESAFALWSDPERAKRILAAAHDAEVSPTLKLRQARVLAMLGDGRFADEVLVVLDGMKWDTGWNFMGMVQSMNCTGWTDRFILALGACRHRAAVPVIVRLAGELEEKSEYSHFRAVANALEAICRDRGEGTAEAAAALAALLAKPGVAGHALPRDEVMPPIPWHANREGDKERTLVLRELALARALYNLGDDAAKCGERILRAYADDPRRAYAVHAKMVLEKRQGKDGKSGFQLGRSGFQPGRSGFQPL